MHHSSHNSFRMAFTLGVGAGILINTLFRKLPPTVKSYQWFNEQTNESIESVKQRIQKLKTFSTDLIANPIPDLYKATDSLTLSEEDIHVSA